MSQEREPHTLAHRVSLGVSVLVLIALAVVLITGVGSGDPARPTATVETVRRLVDGTSHVVVEVVNEGHRAADGVQVSASLTIDGDEQTGDQTIDFLGAGEQRHVVFVFTGDPADGELEVAVTSFAVP